MPRIIFNSKVMHSGTSSKDSLDEIVGSKSALILDNSHAFNASYGMLYSYSKRRYSPVVLFFFHRKFTSSWLFDRLENSNPFRFISLIPGILIQLTGIGKGIHCIGYFFIMRLSTNARADKKNQTASRNNHCIFERVFLFLSTVILLLLIRVAGTGNLPLCTVMQQNRKRICALPGLEQG